MEHSMARYFFNVKSDAFDADDVEGEECASIDAARGRALAAAGELIRRELANGLLPRFGWIEVADRHRRLVLRLPLRAAAS